MALDSQKLVFLDCQTTGMHPSLGHLLELAWISPLGSRSFLLRLPEGEEIPYRVQDVTSIRMADMVAAVDPEVALLALESDLQEMGAGALLVAHYAQFERAFLEDLTKKLRDRSELPAKLLCTYKISKKLFPQIPSRNIRALTGYFGLGQSEIKRAGAHATATAAIWSHLEKELSIQGIENFELLEAWLAEKKPKKAPAKIEYRVDRLKRLELPDEPGVYRMLTAKGDVLYVGKATSLKSRVNSYFRGQKNRDRRKLEMLAQAWDIKITVCESPLEAALLENEEIKRLDPPYNVSLRAGRRRMVFFSRDFSAKCFEQDELHPLGPFSLSSAIELLQLWLRGMEANSPAQILYEPIPQDLLAAGYALVHEKHSIPKHTNLRQLLALALQLARAQAKLDLLLEEVEETEEEEIEEESEEEPLTAEEVGARLEGLLLRAASEYLRSKSLTRLLNARVEILPVGRTLETRYGKIWHSGAAVMNAPAAPWQGLDIVDYDRMSVLLSEVVRHSYPVERVILPRENA